MNEKNIETILKKEVCLDRSPETVSSLITNIARILTDSYCHKTIIDGRIFVLIFNSTTPEK